jgi:hypothetical protein
MNEYHMRKNDRQAGIEGRKEGRHAGIGEIELLTGIFEEEGEPAAFTSRV